MKSVTFTGEDSIIDALIKENKIRVSRGKLSIKGRKNQVMQDVKAVVGQDSKEVE